MSNWIADAGVLNVDDRMSFKDDRSTSYKTILEALQINYPGRRFNIYGHGGRIWIIRKGDINES